MKARAPVVWPHELQDEGTLLFPVSPRAASTELLCHWQCQPAYPHQAHFPDVHWSFRPRLAASPLSVPLAVAALEDGHRLFHSDDLSFGSSSMPCHTRFAMLWWARILASLRAGHRHWMWRLCRVTTQCSGRRGHYSPFTESCIAQKRTSDGTGAPAS